MKNCESNSLNLFKGCNIIEKLKKKIPFDVLQIFFSKEDGFKILNVELPDTDLKSIEEKTRVISKIIDELDYQEENYFLNVYSKGTEQEFSLLEADNFINEYIQVKTNKHYLEKNLWEGYLTENENNQIILLINNKGRKQKLKIDKNHIKEIKLTAKITKEK